MRFDRPRPETSAEALMRWEWEGGTPAAVGVTDNAVRTKSAERTSLAENIPEGQPYAGRVLSPVLLVLVSLSTVLAAMALGTALLVQPPTLGWVGFAILCLVVLTLGVATTMAVPRLRVSPLVPAVAKNKAHRLLVVADAACSPPALADAIRERTLQTAAICLVVPVRVSHLHFLTNDEESERSRAELSLARTVQILRRRGFAVTGKVGDDKPLESMTDALGAFPANHVLLAVPPERESYWLERNLLTNARRLTTVEISQVIVPTRPPASDV
jgi:hypothetical protein